MLDVGEQYPEVQSFPDPHASPLAPFVHVVPPAQNPDAQSLPVLQFALRAPVVQEPPTQYPDWQSLPRVHTALHVPAAHISEVQSLHESHTELLAPSVQTRLVLRQVNEEVQSVVESQAEPLLPSVQTRPVPRQVDPEMQSLPKKHAAPREALHVALSHSSPVSQSAFATHTAPI